MEYRQLGKSGLRVSVLGMGTLTFGGVGDFARVGSTDVEEARRQFELCLDAGVNFIDTANAYSHGVAEEITGAALGARRNDVVLATKVRFATGTGPNDAGLSRAHIVAACEASLRRLKTDWIDLYQVHAWDGQTPLEETFGALDDLVRSGKIRYVGVSNYSAWHLMKALGTVERRGFAPIVSQQIYYTLAGREAEFELLPITVDQGVGAVVWSPLAGGLLSGKYRRSTAPAGADGGRHLTDWDEPPIHDEDKLYDIVEELVSVGAELGASAAQVALAWLLQRPTVSSVVIGARTEAQLMDNLASSALHLTPEHVERLDKVSALNLPYPYWHQLKTTRDRMGPADLSLMAPYMEAQKAKR